jgi:hypothetical protein
MNTPTREEAEAILRRIPAYVAALAPPEPPPEASVKAPAAGPGPDQQVCPNSSMPAQQVEKVGHNRRSPAVQPQAKAEESTPAGIQCGRVALLRERRTGQGVAARLYCKRKACPDCGPRRRQRLTDHYTAAIGDTPVVGVVIARSAWSTTAKRLTRSKASYLRIPAPRARYVVFATAGPGDPVADVAAALASAFAAMPSDTARVSSSRCWAERTADVAAGVAVPGGGGGGAGGGGEAEDQGGYELLGMAKVSLAHVIAAARDLGIYQGPIPDTELPADWAEAHRLELPGDQLAYKRFIRRIGLHWPDRHGHSKARAA